MYMFGFCCTSPMQRNALFNIYYRPKTSYTFLIIENPRNHISFNIRFSYQYFVYNLRSYVLNEHIREHLLLCLELCIVHEGTNIMRRINFSHNNNITIKNYLHSLIYPQTSAAVSVSFV